LKLETKTHDELICEYPRFKNINNGISDDDILLEGGGEQENIDAVEYAENQNKIDIIERIIQSMTTGKMEMNTVSNKHQLREWIHDTHNFLRNSGAGYGMKPLNLFILFYGLMRLEEYGMLSHEDFKELNDEKFQFSNLVKLVNESKSEGEDKLSELYKIIRGDDGILDKLHGTHENHPLRDTLFYEIPKHIGSPTFAELITRINEIKNIEKQSNLQLSGKVYEYFIGRDESAISALGAFFTDRPIPRLVFDKILIIDLTEDKKVPTMIDPFGGSGGFVTEYISKINKDFKDVDWSENTDSINHYDMNDDVVKISGLEIMCLTKTKMKMKETINSFLNEFDNKKFMYVISNPPYGGDSFNSELIKPKNDLLNEINNALKNDKKNQHLKCQKKKLEDEIKQVKKQHSKNIVSIENSSQRIKNYAKKYDLIGTCKEIVSMILFMDLLEENGTACIVMKQGFFFDKSKQYVTLRKHLLKYFNVSEVIKIPEGSFENTNCVTSLIVFHKNGPTKEIEFSDLIVNEYSENKFVINENGYMEMTESQGDINEVDYRVVKSVPISKIEGNDIVSLDICDYGNFILKENEDTAISINTEEVIDINHVNEIETSRDTFYDLNIGCIEKNKIIKHKTLLTKDKLKKNHFLKVGDIIISGCRPNSDKTRLITQSDIDSGYTTGISKVKVKDEYKDKYPPIYIYAILYEIIGEKSVKGGSRNNAERMFAKSTSYPTIKLEMFHHIDLPLHKDNQKIDEWTTKLSSVYDNDMKNFKKYSKELFSEIISEFTLFSE
jgi:type I restriction-modification system DNA methylase subunit